MVSQPVMVTIVTARCIPLQLALGSVCHLRGNSYPCTCKNQFGWGSIFVHPKKKLYHAHGRSLLVSSPAVCTQKRVSVLLGIVYYPTSSSVLVWLIPSLIPNPAPFPTGRVISGGDEEDPDHAGNPGERIWEGTTPHTAYTVRDSTCSVAGTRQVKSCNNMYLCVCVFVFFLSSSLRLWWWGGISTSLKTSMRSTWRTLNHSQVFTTASANTTTAVFNVTVWSCAGCS